MSQKTQKKTASRKPKRLTQIGHYWFKPIGGRVWYLQEVSHDWADEFVAGSGSIHNKHGTRIAELHGTWMGPIPQPTRKLGLPTFTIK
ncbi:MAG: hypothetical protein A2846_01495 [Candidatus Doudnabacteria bacterium RIFCSPHIGHO2_01_FULL_49_9]|uniref:Uncharacterized protein n=1 Tax=Candidatus Doudnabacteria bacterium RIFCSPHIGHO2_01_FULL_49_9 TaxID=1817827 RepID=A0A1F5NYI7_9BACT|nr:MAG: hypothetical protein A2846_01495 [Candidatus Doudnabacteria bacterium RIFCSPHIGHO2_01_FULL_49_9]